MAASSNLDTALLATTTAARLAAKEAKIERAQAMDWVIDLLFERAAYRLLCREAIPYLWTAPGRSAALADQAMLPRTIAQAMEEILNA